MLRIQVQPKMDLSPTNYPGLVILHSSQLLLLLYMFTPGDHSSQLPLIGIVVVVVVVSVVNSSPQRQSRHLVGVSAVVGQESE